MERHRRSISKRIAVGAVLVAAALLAACGDSEDDSADGDRPTVVVTTSILGDVVENLTGGAVDVSVLMPAGVDPHQFQISARQAAEVAEADALVVNGGRLEEGLVDVIASAESDGASVIVALDAVEPLTGADDDHDHDHGHDHDHREVDPHFFTDPARMADVVDSIAIQLVDDLDGIDADTVTAAAADYADELRALASEVDEILASVAAPRRTLVTTHDVLGYFADAYDFEIVGTVIPSASTSDSASAGLLAELAETVEAEGVTTVFVDASAPDGLSQTLADEVGGVSVVELFTESLGESGSGGATYVDMIRTNAQRIAEALA